LCSVLPVRPPKRAVDTVIADTSHYEENGPDVYTERPPPDRSLRGRELEVEIRLRVNAEEDVDF
jgi:hypothetical protein